MREYASPKLREAGEGEALDERYVEYYRTRCRDVEDDARHRPVEWLRWVDLEIDNIRPALQKCLATSHWRQGSSWPRPSATTGSPGAPRRVGAGSTSSSQLPRTYRTFRQMPFASAGG